MTWYMMVVFHHDEPEIMNILTLARRRDFENYKILSERMNVLELFIFPLLGNYLLRTISVRMVKTVQVVF